MARMTAGVSWDEGTSQCGKPSAHAALLSVCEGEGEDGGECKRESKTAGGRMRMQKQANVQVLEGLGTYFVDPLVCSADEGTCNDN